MFGDEKDVGEDGKREQCEDEDPRTSERLLHSDQKPKRASRVFRGPVYRKLYESGEELHLMVGLS